MGSSGVCRTIKGRRPGVEALLTADIINTIGLSVFSCEKQDPYHLLHESGWHAVCIHSLSLSIKYWGPAHWVHG